MKKNNSRCRCIGFQYLAALQQTWENQIFAPAVVRSLEGELIFGITACELFRKSNKEAVGLLYGLEKYLPVEDSDRPFWERNLRNISGGEAVADFVKEQVYCRIWRFAWLDQSERRYLESMQRLLEITRTATTEKSYTSIRPAIARFEQDCMNKNFYDELRYPNPDSPSTLSRVVKKAMCAETERSIVIRTVTLTVVVPTALCGWRPPNSTRRGLGLPVNSSSQPSKTNPANNHGQL